MDLMRIWTEVDINEIKDHIVMVNELLGYCPHCKKLNIDLKDLKKCPSCEKEFKFVTSADSRNGKAQVVVHIKRKLPHLTFVDYDDYIHLTGKNEAKNLFKV